MGEVILWAIVWIVVAVLAAAALFVIAAIVYVVVTKLREGLKREGNQE
ncbi:hypothetical protein SEA_VALENTINIPUFF_106 [Microbacterium phage ValentiniPuff]|uniref:SAYSvFN domain-containing protein n=1 Tax=Microbacterium phage ValentiniPuff TaxID=2315705 RepID=A0A386KQ89_9CAUD|nr:hypothetical protein SEA_VALENTINIPUFF_106 [Microbacterium phage ValentiniPuff]